MRRFPTWIEFLAAAVLFGLAQPNAVPAQVPAAGPVPQPSQAAEGRIGGRVIDQDTGRPLASARISMVGIAGVLATDLDGRFRSPSLPPGRYTVRAALIGYRMAQMESVLVTSGETRLVAFALSSAPVVLAEIQVAGDAAVRATSEAGLLAQQRSAASVSDGISAEAISRSPDADAGDAVARVTGVSIVDNRFVVVRGLNERYSGTLLNGSELPSPEPLKRVVPLDIFPASLLESIVTTKGATPDKPGDFSGGLVEIRTKEFPEEFVAQLRTSQEYNSVATFRKLRTVPRQGTDYVGFDDGRRAMPAGAPALTEQDPAVLERFGESIRGVWTPLPRRAAPNRGFGFNVGGQLPVGRGALGAVVSITYSGKTEARPDRLFQFVEDPEGTAGPVKGYFFNEAQSIVDWGGILNLSARAGAYHKLGWKNFYSRNAEETVISSTGFETDRGERGLDRYQVRYIERDLLQSQLSGEHLFPGLADLRVEWRLSSAWARRDEPDNRSATYIRESGIPTLQSSLQNYIWFRFLDDQSRSGQADVSLPFTLRQQGDGLLKVGVWARRKDRTFQADVFSFSPVVAPPDGIEVFQLPPEQAFAPENIGRNILLEPAGLAQSYQVADHLDAAYAMVDVELLRGVRLVGGLRVEDWRLDLFLNTRADPLGVPTVRRNRDYLWSGNLTLAVSDRMQLRLGGARTVARPDSRELSPDQYEPIGGECVSQGNPDLQRTSVLNGDVRWEFYPRPGELFAISGFYKEFDAPVVETVDSFGNGNCRVNFHNAEAATNAGVEVEVRRRLEFLPGILRQLQASANLTLVRSRATLGEGFSLADARLTLPGQSPILVNGSLHYASAGGAFEASVLLNYFADRTIRYGLVLGQTQVPHVTERGRMTLDAKLQQAFGPLTMTLSGRNLGNAPVHHFQRSAIGPITTGYHRAGTSISLGLGYDF